MSPEKQDFFLPVVSETEKLRKEVEALSRQRGSSEKLIDSTVLTAPAALITFANIPNIYEHLLIRWYARGSTAATSVNALLRFNNDVGANYDRLLVQISTGGLGTVAVIADTFILAGELAAGTAPADVFDMGRINIFGYASTIGQKVLMASNTLKTALAAGSLLSNWTPGWWRDTSVITEIDISPSAGNFIAGSRFDLFGVQGGP